jgi:hypothetical protein
MADANFPAGSTLHLNQAWTSGSGRTALRLQADRNLVLYKDGRAAFQAPNAFSRGNSAIMQEDGNFVLYDTAGSPVWATDTSGHPGAHLAVQEDGNLVVYLGNRALFATNTGD